MTARLWGGRFRSGPSPELTALSRSTEVDWRLAPQDIMQTSAHVGVLQMAGLLSAADAERITEALAEMSREVAAGTLIPAADDEDVHTVIERTLIERVGDLGARIRAGRSRNDQVATDLRLYCLAATPVLAQQVCDLADALLEQAERTADWPAPGYTHLQRAQPVTLGHELAKHVHALLRDLDRLVDWRTRCAVSPLGAGAIAGSPFALDPQGTAEQLGFSTAFANSIDAVGDRDFVAELLFVCALLGVHLSRLGEEITLWCASEFAVAQLADEWSTGSSIMPQKKNPDIAELARGRSARLIGDLTTVLVLLKALPFGYNRDLQEDKPPLFDALDTLALTLPALTGCVRTLTFNAERLRTMAPAGHALATEVADELARAGIPFAIAHEITGRLVAAADERGVALGELTDEQCRAISPHLTPTVMAGVDLATALARRTVPGGTAPARVREQVIAARSRVADRRVQWRGQWSPQWGGQSPGQRP